MYRNCITFSRICERHQSLARMRSTSMSCLPILAPSTLQIFRSSSLNSSCGHAAMNYTTVNHLSSKSGFGHFYRQPPHQNSCFSLQEAKRDGFSLFSASPYRCYASTTIPEMEGHTLIHLCGYETGPFGFINVTAPFDVLIKPLNPEKYPEMNRVLVKIFSPEIEEDESNENSKRSLLSDFYKMETSVIKDQFSLIGKIPKEVFGDHLPQITCVLELPIKFSINVEVEGDASVSVSDMEGDDIFIRCQRGNCWLKNIKTRKIDVYCETGSLESSGVLQGNIRLGCGGDGSLKAHRLQGSNVSCRTVRGNMDITNIYSVETLITASEKTILHLGSCHGKTYVNINSGDINIKSVEGNLEAITKSGDVDVVLSNVPKKAYVCSKKGDVVIGLPRPANMDLDFLATGIQLTRDFAYLLDQITESQDKMESWTALQCTIGQKGGCRVTGDAKSGILTIKYQDWLSSMGLKLSEDD